MKTYYIHAITPNSNILNSISNGFWKIESENSLKEIQKEILLYDNDFLLSNILEDIKQNKNIQDYEYIEVNNILIN